LVELDFASGFLRLTNAAQEFTWNGYTWTGAGALGTVSPVEETGDLQARGMAFKITGIDASNVTRALAEHYQGRSAKVWLALLDDNYNIIADPILAYTGRMDIMSIELGQTATITVTSESHLVTWETPKVRRYNHADQLQRFPADLGCEFVEQMVSKELVWGRA
jgi:hypothetical protein